MKSKINVLFGQDPEFLATEDEHVLVPFKVEGTKKAPFPIPGRKGWYQQQDGPCLELNCDPVPFDLESVRFRMLEAQSIAYELAEHYLDYPRVTLSEKDCLEVPEGIFYETGCRPDLNVYRKKSRFTFPKFACAGWHIHLGLECPLPKGVLINFLDATTEPFHAETAGFRQEINGFLGQYRETLYGVEYRTPGRGIIKRLDGFIKGLELALEAYHICSDHRTALYPWWEKSKWGERSSIHNFSERPELKHIPTKIIGEP